MMEDEYQHDKRLDCVHRGEM